MLSSLVVLQAASDKTRVKLLADVKGIGRKGEIVFVSPSMYTNVRGSALLPQIFFLLNFHYFTKGTASEEVCSEDIRRGNEEHAVPRERGCAAGVRKCSESG
jgi:hypothetical protein